MARDISTAKRYRVLERDDFRCRYCGTAATDGASLVIDHVVPIAAGGSSRESNLAAACEACNGGKSNHLPSQALIDEVREAQLQRERERSERRACVRCLNIALFDRPPLGGTVCGICASAFDVGLEVAGGDR